MVAWTEPPQIHHNGIIANYTIMLTDINDTTVNSLSTNETSMQLNG